MSIQAWTSTSTFLAIRRQRSLSPKTIPENRIPLLRPIPLLHPLLLPLMSDLLLISSFLFFFFFLLGLGLRTYVAFSLINIHFFTTFVSYCAFHAILNQPRGCMVRIERLG